MKRAGDQPATISVIHESTPVPRHTQLMVVSGPDKGVIVVLEPGTYRVGKARDCHLRLSDASVSRDHLSIEVTDHSMVVRDLGSKNGSRFRGAQFEQINVTVGSTISIGNTELRFVAPSHGLALEASASNSFGALVGSSAAIRQVFSVLERLAPLDVTVLISGETGTGKELAARGLHDASDRASKPFVVVDLAALPGSMIESELFGHAKGAFTGAEVAREGAFEAAGDGTVFLDEIGELDLGLQPRLLRVLESRSFKRVGENRYRNMGARVIAATNRNLPQEVTANRFRQDLFHRLAVACVKMPPLRERPEDVPMLVEHIVALLERAGLPRLSVCADTKAALAAHDWPGNVRQLRNVLERAAPLAPNGVLDVGLLGLDTDTVRQAAPMVDTRVPFKEAKERLIWAWEHAYLEDLLASHDGNISDAARAAGIDRVHLHRLVKKHRS